MNCSSINLKQFPYILSVWELYCIFLFFCYCISFIAWSLVSLLAIIRYSSKMFMLYVSCLNWIPLSSARSSIPRKDELYLSCCISNSARNFSKIFSFLLCFSFYVTDVHYLKRSLSVERKSCSSSFHTHPINFLKLFPFTHLKTINFTEQYLHIFKLWMPCHYTCLCFCKHWCILLFRVWVQHFASFLTSHILFFILVFEVTFLLVKINSQSFSITAFTESKFT